MWQGKVRLWEIIFSSYLPWAVFLGLIRLHLGQLTKYWTGRHSSSRSGHGQCMWDWSKLQYLAKRVSNFEAYFFTERTMSRIGAICSGSFISKRHVLTARSCFQWVPLILKIHGSISPYFACYIAYRREKIIPTADSPLVIHVQRLHINPLTKHDPHKLNQLLFRITEISLIWPTNRSAGPSSMIINDSINLFMWCTALQVGTTGRSDSCRSS